MLEATRIVAVALAPITPTTSRRIYQQLGFSEDKFDSLSWVRAHLSVAHSYCIRKG